MSNTKKYPYAGPVSKQLYPERIKIEILEENLVNINFQSFAKPDENNAHEWVDFMTSRCYDLQQALEAAEGQIEDILTDNPFIPEEFGFVLSHKPETIHDKPIRLYSSLLDDRYTLYREIVDIHADELESSKWVLTKRDGYKFNPLEVIITSSKVAETLFIALGVTIEENQNDGSESPIIEEKAEQGNVPWANEEEKQEWLKNNNPDHPDYIK